ncbi:MAG: pilus assembly PilX N-terminal domain-containing protein [Planctomycetota bacterium]
MWRRRATGRSGSALILALLVVTSVAVLSLAILQLTGATTRRQEAATDDRQAFYLAEAGLSESYVSLGTGGTGAIGSIAAPTTYGGGLVWVDLAPPLPDDDEDLLRLESTGLYGRGRSTLEMAVRRTTRPFGIFSVEPLVLESPFLIDGYDSEASDYFDQVGFPSLRLPHGHPWYPQFSMLSFDGWWYRVESMVERPESGEVEVFWKYRLARSIDVDDLELPGVPLTTTDDDLTVAQLLVYDFDLAMFLITIVGTTSSGVTVQYAEGGVEESSGSAESSYDYHTTAGGSLGSNGDITIDSPVGAVEIYGDIVAGPSSTTDLGTGTSVSGTVGPRPAELALSPVTVPSVGMLPGFNHGSLIPRVLPAADVGYDFITVAPGAEVVVQGPGTLVVSDLSLTADARLSIENVDGPVNVYVTGSARLEEGSVVDVAGRAPQDLSLQIAGDAGPIELNASSRFYGMVYGPQAEVSVGAGFEIFGTLAARNLQLAPYSRLHFDSGVMGNSGAVPLPRFISWQIDEVPRRVRSRALGPLALLELNVDDLAPLGSAREMRSWTLIADHWYGWRAERYEGPAEDWHPVGADSYTVWGVRAPDADADGAPSADAAADEWTLTVRWRALLGDVREYSGPLGDFEGLLAREVYTWEVTGS